MVNEWKDSGKYIPVERGANGENDGASSWRHLRLGQLVNDKKRRKTVRFLVRVDKRVSIFSLQPAGVQLRQYKTSDDASKWGLKEGWFGV